MKTGQLLLERFTVGPLQENCYLLGGAGSDTAVLVDPGDEAEVLAAGVSRSSRRLEAILLTHAHFDHVGAVADLLDRFQVPVYLHPADRQLLEYASFAANQWGLSIRQPPLRTVELKHEQRLELAGLSLACLHTPGHAPGHIAFYSAQERLLVAGDALFRGSIGRTDLPFGDSEQLLESIRRELLVLPPETLVLPGHGESTTIGAEQESNPYLV